LETKDCISFKVRKLDRLLARQYDYVLAEAQLTSPQFSLLRHIYRFGPITIKDLALKMGFEHSSLSRNLRIAEKNGWVKIQKGVDARSRVITTTRSGNQTHQKAKILWERHQTKVIEILGREAAMELSKMVDRAIEKVETYLITE
jgi:DNA-binding MarR family transcriptional regulator